MKKTLLNASLTLIIGWATAVPAITQAREKGPALPATPKHPVMEEIFGVKLSDDYRWLEDWDNPAVQAWSEEQNQYARDFLSRLPGLAAIRGRVKELASKATAQHFALTARGGKLFALKAQPPKQQPFLVVLKSPEDPGSERVLLDPNTLDPTGATRIDFYVPSRDGQRLAVSLSERGTESGTVRIVEVDPAKKELADRIPRANGGTAGGSVAWNADGSGFFYTRYPRPGERPPEDMDFFQQVYFHRLGTPTDTDTYEIGREFPRIAETVLKSSDDGRFVLASVANGDGGQFAHFLHKADGSWVQITHFEDKVVGADFAPSGGLYLLSRAGASRGKILHVSLDAPSLEKAVVVVPETETVIQEFLATPGLLYVSDIVGGPSQVRIFKPGSQTAPGLLPLPTSSTLSGLEILTGDTVLYNVQSYVTPPAWFRFTPGGKPVRTGLFSTSPVDFSDCEAVRETATSKDGTKVPFTVIHRKGIKFNGSNPALLTGYGGFGISLTPGFSAGIHIWLEQGGVYAVANLRGGGEFGEAWHEAGKLTAKQNVFDDFAACARRLIEAGYTSPGKLAIEGGSNGGLLMGAMVAQHPELFRAVVAHVGLYDMLRFERLPNGQFNITEYGTVKDEVQFKAILAYSPYQHVVDGTAYPAVLFLTGANDPRVDPANSRKMTARLQAATSSGRPVLLRTSSSTGHIGSPLTERIEQGAAVYAFLFHELGVSYHVKLIAPAHN